MQHLKTLTKVFSCSFALAMLLGLTACSQLVKAPITTPPSIAELQKLDPDARPRLAVLEFKDIRNASFIPEIGIGVADMLTTALIQTNAVVLVERSIFPEIQCNCLSADLKTDENDHFLNELEYVDYLIVGAVTEFKGNPAVLGKAEPGIGAGIARGCRALMNGARIDIDIRVIDVRTERILQAVSVQANSREAGGSMRNVFTVLTGNTKRPTEKALQICMNKSVEEIAKAIGPKWKAARHEGSMEKH